MGAVDLKSVLARVAGSAGYDGLAVHIYFLKGVEYQVLDIQSQHLYHLLLGLGTLHGNLAVVVALMVNLYIVVLGLLLNPCYILVDVGGIDYQEEFAVALAVNQQVVNAAAGGVEHHAVENLAWLSACHIVGEDVLHKLLCLGAGDFHLAHVAHVEDAHLLPYGQVLVLDVGILNRHVETAERTNHGSQSHVFVIETSSFVFCHFY